MLLKTRKAKRSDRGLYLQDSELQKTVFQPGGRYKWAVDVKNRKVIILPSDSGEGNLVSKRSKQDELKPVIDIRSKEALSAFEGCDYLQVEIFNDRIQVEGFVQQEQTDSASLVQTKKGKKGRIADIQQLISVKKKASVSFTRDQLRMVAGGSYEQDQIDWSILHSAISAETEDAHSIYSIEDALTDLSIPLQVASLFSGAGLMDMGFIEAGFDVVFALEANASASETYRLNIGDHVYTQDIKQLDKSTVPPVSVIIGGSPCQGFSNSNRYTNFLDNPNNELVNEYIQTVQSNSDVKVFVLENVPQLLTAGDGKFLSEIKEKLSDFQITEKVLHAEDYGSAQARKRAFVIGSKIGPIDFPQPTVTVPKTVREAFEGLSDQVPNQTDITKPKEETLERMKHVPMGGNVHDIPEYIRPSGTHSTMYKRLDWEKPACSIVNFRKAMIMPPSFNRVLSVREAARLFDLKDSFLFAGGLSDRQQQVANAVPVQMAMAVANEVKKAFQRYHIRLKNTFRKQQLAFL